MPVKKQRCMGDEVKVTSGSTKSQAEKVRAFWALKKTLTPTPPR